jgi:LysR family transcriptional regulator, transcriptional activator of the cysJI operon
MMELFQLRSFLRVAEEGNVTRAAEALYLTQPAVTQHILSLERELGVKLFDRTGKGVRLTAAGDALRAHARRSLADLDECRQVIADLESGASGKLTLGAGVTTCIFDLPEWLATLQQTYPGVDVAVRTGRSREVTSLVLDREIDLGFITTPQDKPELVIQSLYTEDYALVASARHPLALKTVRLSDLVDVQLILFPPGSAFRDALDRALANAGVTASVRMETDSVEAIKGFVEVGLGVSFLPQSAIEVETRSGKLVPIPIHDWPGIKRTTYVIYRTDRYLSAAARGFLGILEERYGLSSSL